MKKKRIAACIVGVVIGIPILLPLLLGAIAMVVVAGMVCIPLILLEYAVTGKVK
jgi:hypothetical protein